MRHHGSQEGHCFYHFIWDLWGLSSLYNKWMFFLLIGNWLCSLYLCSVNTLVFAHFNFSNIRQKSLKQAVQFYTIASLLQVIDV